MKNREIRWPKPLGLVLLALSILLTPQFVHAHTRTEVGPYVVIIGWENEPVIVGERNAIIFEIHDEANDKGINGAESTLDIEVMYAGQTFRSNLSATTRDGYYTAEIFPTVRGQYSVRLFGAIEDEEVDVVLEPEEVLSAARLQFPEVAPDTRDLQADIVELEAAVSSMRTVSFVAVAFGLLGIGLAAFALTRTQKK